jgi:hypothetical protein
MINLPADFHKPKYKFFSPLSNNFLQNSELKRKNEGMRNVATNFPT